MDLYGKGYFEALVKNQEETEKWTTYRKELAEVQKHLMEYKKTPKVNIMVPIGSKALMPGYLYHTSEVLVSHGSGYFSDCTTSQAVDIANKRIQTADEWLNKLEVERELYQNKLDLPFKDAFTEGGSQEIIEEYDEEQEKKWRIEHRQKIKEQKQKEAEARKDENVEKTDENIISLLDELELMEELENEMEALETEDSEKLITGEIQLQEKTRIAHKGSTMLNEEILVNGNVGIDKENLLESEEVETVEYDSQNDDDDEEDDPISEEFHQLLESTKSMGKRQKIKAFRAELLEICSLIEGNTISVGERLRLYDLRYEIEEALDFMETSEQEEMKNDEGEKKIKFAEIDDVKQFNKLEAACKISEEEKNDNTLYLNISHSPAVNPDKVLGSGDEIKSPADIYRLFGSGIKEEPSTKSILKNRDMVLAETRNEIPAEKKPKKKLRREQFNERLVNVIGDIVEHKSDPLPDEKRDQPDKKVSKFKKSRAY